MVQGKFCWGAKLLTKVKNKTKPLTRNVKFVVNIQYNSFNIDRVLSHTIGLLIFSFHKEQTKTFSKGGGALFS